MVWITMEQILVEWVTPRLEKDDGVTVIKGLHDCIVMMPA